tara:strand:- start:348 stop:467 length:120 start_codon:yes stop_codon:yes gene_type:complete
MAVGLVPPPPPPLVRTAVPAAEFMPAEFKRVEFMPGGDI